MQFTSTQKQAAAWAAITAFFVLTLWLLGPALTPFLVAFVFAYALTPVVNLVHARVFKNRISRTLTVLCVEILFLLLVLSVLLLIVPVISKELPILRTQLPLVFDRFTSWLEPLLAQLGISVALDITSLKELALQYLDNNAENSLNSVMSSLKLGSGVALAVLGNAVLIPVALFYFLKDWSTVVARTVDLVPLRLRASYDHFMHESDEVLGQYLRGQLLVMLALALFYSVGMLLFGLDLALPIGIFTGLASFVPYLGFGLGLVLATLAAILQFGVTKALVMLIVVYGAGQLLESFYLTPTLVGERVGLHPLAVIFALLAFGQLLGFVGILVALPASAVLLVAIRRLRSGYMQSSLYTGGG